MEGAWGFLPPHLRQGVSQWDHLLGRQKQDCHFRFHCGLHDILHYLGDGEEGPFQRGMESFSEKKNVGTSSAS